MCTYVHTCAVDLFIHKCLYMRCSMHHVSAYVLVRTFLHAPECMQVCFCVQDQVQLPACLCFCAHVCMCVDHPASCSVVKSLTPPHIVKEFQSSRDRAWTALGNSSFWKEWRMFPFMVAPGPFCSCLASTRRYILACSGVVTKHARPQPQLGPTTGSCWGRAGPGMTEMPALASRLCRCWGRRSGNSSPPACPHAHSAFSFFLISYRGSPLSLSPCLAALKNECF